MNMTEWAEKEIEIACKRERGESTDEWDYGCACYESALKAFKSLCEDGHSGFSISMTKHILNRLIEGKPLTPIYDTDDVWSSRCRPRDDYTSYQNMRMSSLFKDVYKDGSVKYHDINRFYCTTVSDPYSTWHNGFVSNLMHEMMPITMPYSPGKDIRVVCEEFLYDPKCGDFDTMGVLYYVDDDRKHDINRFFKEGEDSWVEISKEEYEERMQKAKGETNA